MYISLFLYNNDYICQPSCIFWSFCNSIYIYFLTVTWFNFSEKYVFTYFISAGDCPISQCTSCSVLQPTASNCPMWQALGNRGFLGTWRVHSPTASSSGASLIRTNPLGLLRLLSANQARVESSYRTTHSSHQPLQKNPPVINWNV